MKHSKTIFALFCFAFLIYLTGCSQHAEDAHEGHDHSSHSHTESHPPENSSAIHSDGTCAAHVAPVSLCFICDASLRDQGRLWCNEHDRYEDRCWLCHPELEDANRAWCNQHHLYEDECFLCRPELKTGASAAAHSIGAAGSVLFCTEHGVPETECGICRPQMIAQLAAGESLKVRLPSTNSAHGAGVQTGHPSLDSITEGVDCYAELIFDQNKLARIVAPLGGIVEAAHADLGGRVAEHEAVASLWSAEIAEAVANAVLSHQTLDRERRLSEQRVTTVQDLQKAEAAHRAACQQLRTFGFTEDRIDALSDDHEESVLLEVRAPFAGEIIERFAVRGELVEAGGPLFTLADRSVMWAMLNIPEGYLARVQIGQTVELHFDSIPGRTFTGQLTWISAEVDERTRMIRARAEVPNPDGTLRARMFARARILTRHPEKALLLPSSAIQQVEGKPLVFVKLSEDLFEARRVELGARADGRVEILHGLNPGEIIALQNVFPLKSQLLISRLGAGCAHE